VNGMEVNVGDEDGLDRSVKCGKVWKRRGSMG
jgi:hypothetical protein